MTAYRKTVLTVVVVLLVVLPGCGGRYPVTGRVTFPDGAPLDEGLVICEMNDGGRIVQARGDLQKDGSFRLGMDRPRNGALPGKYRVLVVPRALTDAERSTQGPIIDAKFERFETSGLSLEVTPGRNELNITVTRPARRTR